MRLFDALLPLPGRLERKRAACTGIPNITLLSSPHSIPRGLIEHQATVISGCPTCSIYKEYIRMLVFTERHESVVWGGVL